MDDFKIRIDDLKSYTGRTTRQRKKERGFATMENYREELRLEEAYLQKTLQVLEKQLAEITGEYSAHRSELIELRKDMVENTAPFSTDIDKLIDIYQYLAEMKSQTLVYANILRFVKRYKTLIRSPYFGRFDFQEDGLPPEKIYIGLATVMDPATRDVYVYDWRAPISSIFYRYELGRVAYQTPQGSQEGEVSLKRQYKIKDSVLQYFFDCKVRITDEILQEVLGRNASPRMKTIVESIQKEQDVIIRDTDSQLLIVQGPAGSGKTSIALHRIAFLLYEGLNTQLRSNDILILSPNDVFSNYISHVLPELGEENVLQVTFDDLAARFLKDRLRPASREEYLEALLTMSGTPQGEDDRQRAEFKGSEAFRRLLDQWIDYYGRKLIPFEDVYFHGRILLNRQELKSRFLHNPLRVPMAKQLAKLESLLLPMTHPFKKERLRRMEEITKRSEGREFEVKSFSRLVGIRESQALRRRIRKFTQVDYLDIYRRLFSHTRFLQTIAARPAKHLGRDSVLPPQFRAYMETTRDYLAKGEIRYEDYAPLIYLKLRVEGMDAVSDIRQVVIDEAQDYTPLHYHIFKQLYGGANFTILGDLRQSVSAQKEADFYQEIRQILNKEKSQLLYLRKSYRSTAEIQTFARRLLPGEEDCEIFARSGPAPAIICRRDAAALHQAIAEQIEELLQSGLETVAVICKTQAQAEKVYKELSTQPALAQGPSITLVRPKDKDFVKGPLVISSIMAKGLEFDAVIVYDPNSENYRNELDQRLLYIACTRALHRLAICHTGTISPFLAE